MKQLSVYIFTLVLALLIGCKAQNTGTNNNKMYDALRQASFIYDLECIPLDKMERADTLWREAIPSEMNGTPYLAYVVTGDCSYCISASIQFFHAYYSEEHERQLGLLVIKGDEEIFRYYVNKENFNDSILNSIKSIPTLNIDESSPAQDGIYLIYNKRIINYVPYKE